MQIGGCKVGVWIVIARVYISEKYISGMVFSPTGGFFRSMEVVCGGYIIQNTIRRRYSSDGGRLLVTIGYMTRSFFVT